MNDDTYTARRILRAAPGGRTHRRLIAEASPRVLRLVEVLPPLLEQYCIARAEEMALAIVDGSVNSD